MRIRGDNKWLDLLTLKDNQVKSSKVARSSDWLPFTSSQCAVQNTHWICHASDSVYGLAHLFSPLVPLLAACTRLQERIFVCVKNSKTWQHQQEWPRTSKLMPFSAQCSSTWARARWALPIRWSELAAEVQLPRKLVFVNLHFIQSFKCVFSRIVIFKQ